MTYDEALAEAVQGGRVRHPGMMPGSFIYYAFSGWRIQFGDGEGSNSGWTGSERDKAADWYFYESPPIGEVVKRVVGGWPKGGFVAKSEPYIVGEKPRSQERKEPEFVIYDEASPIDVKVWATKLKLDPNKGGW